MPMNLRLKLYNKDIYLNKIQIIKIVYQLLIAIKYL